MVGKMIWNGREIVGHDPELQAHISDIIQREFIPYAFADPVRAKRILRQVMTDADGNQYLADLDGNYTGPIPSYLKT